MRHVDMYFITESDLFTSPAVKKKQNNNNNNKKKKQKNRNAK